jgi:hypothetical protein
VIAHIGNKIQILNGSAVWQLAKRKDHVMEVYKTKSNFSTSNLPENTKCLIVIRVQKYTEAWISESWKGVLSALHNITFTFFKMHFQ